MKITVLGSGSKGNCTYIETEETKILIDCGFSFRQVKNRLAVNGIEISNLDGVLVSHEHTDHVSGIPSLLGNVDTKIYANTKTYEGIHRNVMSAINVGNMVYIEDELVIKDIKITTFRVSHDTNDPVGYIVEHNDKKVVLVTDTGYLPEKLFPLLKDADVYLFESNFEPELLLDSSRPYFLKKRIFGNKGHLSNLEAGVILNNLVTERTKHIVFIHLSRECNTRFDARIIHEDVIEKYNEIDIEYSFQDKPTRIINL